MKIKWLNQLRRTEVALSPLFFQGTDIFPQRVVFHYGYWKKEVTVSLKDELAENEIGFSNKMFGELTVPDICSYELKWDGRNLTLGPVIAFMTVAKTERLIENLDRFESYFVNYDQFQGLIYICAIDGVDKKEKTIDGLFYDYTEEKREDRWKEGTFPYPGAMYRKTGFSSELYDEFISTIGDKMFNTYFFDKWQLWRWLSSSHRCRSYLPETKKLEQLSDIDELLEKYGEVYLKKINSHKAKGIIKVEKSKDEYHFIYRLRGTKVFKESEIDKINEFLKEINKKKDYLVQQAIPIKTYENRNFDFRVIMQKDRSGKWICNANIARFGKKESIATNFLLDGFATTGNDALKIVFNYSERDAFNKEQEMLHACEDICEKLDRCAGHYGDLGVDVIVDENEKVWILEVNKLHDHKYPQYALEDEQMYFNVVTTPFEYAARLAGF